MDGIDGTAGGGCIHVNRPGRVGGAVTGSVSDPQDAPINIETNQRDTDAKSVSASYDRDTGEFILTVELWVGVYALPSQYVSVYTEANLHGTTCSDGPQHLGISLSAYVGPGYPYTWAAMGQNESSATADS